MLDPVETLAAIDVGTNSIHLVVARVTGVDRFEVVTSEKEMVRLGTGSGDMKRLTPEAIQRGVETLRRMKQIADIDGAPVRAVATSAVREAENHDEFVARAREEAGVEVEVISGVEEARLIHLGVLQAIPVFDRRLLLCDIGGGSTEVLVGQQGQVLTARSFKLGAVRLTNRFFAGERLHPSAVSSCRTYIRSTFSPYGREVAAHGFEVAAGSSGTIQAVAAIAQAATGAERPRSFNRYRVTADEVRAVAKALAAAPSVKQRGRIPGVDADRADIILAGALILEGVVETFGVEELEVSEYALREGVLLDTIQRSKGGSLHHLRDVSRHSVLHLAQLCDEEPEHSAHVARLAVELFDQLTAIPELTALAGLGEPAREYLEAGALLANVGLFISHSRHHLHSYYVVRNSEVLTGLTDDEIEIIALLARYHRKSSPRPATPSSPASRPTTSTWCGPFRASSGWPSVSTAATRAASGAPAATSRVTFSSSRSCRPTTRASSSSSSRPSSGASSSKRSSATRSSSARLSPPPAPSDSTVDSVADGRRVRKVGG